MTVSDQGMKTEEDGLSPSRISYIVPKSDVGRSSAPITYSYYLSKSVQEFLGSRSFDTVFSAVPLPGSEAWAAGDFGVVEMDGGHRIRLHDQAARVDRVALCCVHAVTSFGDQIVWDIVHDLPVGGQLVIVEPGQCASSLSRDYFRGCLAREEAREGGLFIETWTKTSLLPSEREAGLDEWSFCVPMERFNKASADKLLRDIERLGLASYELVVSCSVPFEEAVDERIRLIVAPPNETSLTAKKNGMAKAARYANLCIFHDRIALPTNFRSAVERFGDHFGIASFQSLYVDWASGRVERYSDMHIELGDGWRMMSAESLNEPDRRGVLYTHGLPIRLRWRTGIAEAHPGEVIPEAYLTGTMYLTKRSIWQMIEQNPKIDWNELEDVEFGLYANTQFGVPSRINPHAFSVSRRARALMLGAKKIAERKKNASRSEFSGPPMMPPSLPGDDHNAELRLRARAWSYVVKHCPQSTDMRQMVFTAPFADQKNWAKYWIRILYSSIVPRNLEQTSELLVDFSTAMFGFSYDRSTLSVLREAIWGGRFFVDVILEDGYFLQSVRNVDAGRVAQMPPKEEMADYIIDQMWRVPENYLLPKNFEEFRDMILAALEAAG